MIIGNIVYIEELSESEVSNSYVNWINDPVVNKYLSVEKKEYTAKDLEHYIYNINKSNEEFIFGIYILSNKKYIGNIKLANVNSKDGAEIGLMIGDKNEWGKGFSTDAISCVEKFAHSFGSIKKLRAGALNINKGSVKAFLKNDFIIKQRVKRIFKDKQCEAYFMEKNLIGKQ